MATAPQAAAAPAPRATWMLIAIPALNAAVLAATLAVHGMDLPGKAITARYTAIFSSLIFGFVLLSRGNGDITRAFAAHRVRLAQSFALSHFVHYAAVLWMWLTPGGNPLTTDGPIMLAIAAFGATHIFLIGWLARKEPTAGGALKAFYAVLIYAALLFFALALFTKVPASLASTSALVWLVIASLGRLASTFR